MNNKDFSSIMNFIETKSVNEIRDFDIRTLWKEELLDYTVKKMKKYIRKDYEIGEITPLKLLCCYKIANNPLGVDCDVSLFSTAVYALAYDVSGNIIELQPGSENKYELRGQGFICAGDTMNSYATVTREYISNIYELNEEKKEKYKKVSSKNVWEVCILDNYETIEPLLPNYMKKFFAYCHTIGNMIPVPYKYFNAPRYAKTDDYWDLTLLGIYYNRFETIIGATPNIINSQEENIKNCQEWYKKYKEEWPMFVKKTYMAPFLNKDLSPQNLCEKGIGKRKRLVPINEKEYESFYTKVTAAIIERGESIATYLKELPRQKFAEIKLNSKEDSA